MDELKEIRLEDSEVEKYLLHDGDVLICEGGHGIGRTAVWRAKESDIVFQKALHRVRPGSALNSDFFAYCMFVYFHALILQAYFTGVGIPHFTGKALSALVFPLPPLAEQQRIVAKVEELLILCDQLETQLTTALTESRNFLETVLNQVIGIMPRRASEQKLETTRRGATRRDYLDDTFSGEQPLPKQELKYMSTNPVKTVAQMIECITALGGTATPERLLNVTGLGDDVDKFFDLLREGRDLKLLNVPTGSNQVIKLLSVPTGSD